MRATPAAIRASISRTRSSTATGASGWRPSRGLTSRMATAAGSTGRSTDPACRPSVPAANLAVRSDGRDPVAPVAEPAVLALGRRQASDDLASQVREVDHGVDHQLRGQPVEVDVLLVETT